MGLRGKTRCDLSPAREHPQVAYGQVLLRGHAQLWRHLSQVALPPLARDVQPELQPIRVPA